MAQDGRLKSVTVYGYQKRYETEKYYTFIITVTRHRQPDPTYVFRSYKEFSEFHQKICLMFPLARLHRLVYFFNFIFLQRSKSVYIYYFSLFCIYFNY